MYHYVAAQSSFMTVYIADVHENVSVVKMATVLEECTTEEQLSVMHFSMVKRTQCKRY
jgi:hypothetical protein